MASFGAAGPQERLLYAKQCLCDHLGNGTLMSLGISEVPLPVAVCPGPNLAYFDRTYSLEEMVDHIYGRGPSLVPEDRPHFFAKELELYVDHWARLNASADPKVQKQAAGFREHLLAGMERYRKLVQRPAFPGENLGSLRTAVEAAAVRMGAALEPALPAIGKQAEALIGA